MFLQSEVNGESFLIQTVDNYLVVAGSDKRGTIYGVYDISEKIGVSPWYYWADVPIKKNNNIYVKSGKYIQDSPKSEISWYLYQRRTSVVCQLGDVRSLAVLIRSYMSIYLNFSCV